MAADLFGIECRPPPGGRGLKFGFSERTEETGASSSTRGTWIEICIGFPRPLAGFVVLHPGDVD